MGVAATPPAEGGVTRRRARHVFTPVHLLPELAAAGARPHLHLALLAPAGGHHPGVVAVAGQLGAGGGGVVRLATPPAVARPARAVRPPHGGVAPPGHPGAPPAA